MSDETKEKEAVEETALQEESKPQQELQGPYGDAINVLMAELENDPNRHLLVLGCLIGEDKNITDFDTMICNGSDTSIGQMLMDMSVRDFEFAKIILGVAQSLCFNDPRSQQHAEMLRNQFMQQMMARVPQAQGAPIPVAEEATVSPEEVTDEAPVEEAVKD